VQDDREPSTHRRLHETLLRKRYALKGDMFKSVVEIRIERPRNRLDILELRRQTNVEILAMHAQDLVRQQYLN